MRRSVAPSQLNSSNKRPRFNPPFVNKINSEVDLNPTIKSVENINVNVSAKDEKTVRNTKDILQLIQSKRSSETDEIAVHEESQILNLEKETQHEVPQTNLSGNQYFNVVWCKLSKKKHKKWEGDAILVVKGRSVILKDTEGKQIGQGSGYKVKDVENLVSGSTLVIGGKEIEILDSIKDSDYASGSCFQNNVKPIMSPVLRQVNKPKPKPTGINSIKKSLFDPTKPNAFVLTRPSEKHQWTYNTQKLPVVEVVVDPKITCHLRVHQKEGILFLYECILGMRDYAGLGAILADEMGLGKTLQCICLIWTLLKQGPFGGNPVLRKVLIATPSSLVQNWVKEFEKWLGKGKIVLYAVDSRHTVKNFLKQPCCPVMIISYEMLVRSYSEIESIKFDLIVCDEGHRLKNIAVKTTSLISRLPIERRILLTGTPVQNDLQEFFSLVDFCNPGMLGSNSSFRRVYEDPIVLSRQPNASYEEKSIGAERAVELARITTIFTLRRTQEVINKFLPPKVENIVFCRPSELQISLTKSILNSSYVKTCLRNPATAHPFACISALKKVCNHPCLLLRQEATKLTEETSTSNSNIITDLIENFPYPKNDLLMEDHSGKMKVLVELLVSTQESHPFERFVVVSGFTKTLDILQEMCHKFNYLFLRLDGSTPTAQRQSIVDLFNQSSTHFIFLLSSKAGGVGFNLIGASRIVLYDIDWNPANDLQAMARVWRDGQKKTVYIYRFLTTGTIEEKIFQRQISKQNLSGAVVDQINSSKIEFTTEDLKDLFTLHENTDCLTHDRLCCQCDQEKQDEIQHEDPAVTRLCQISVIPKKSNVKTTNLNMTELHDWKHFTSSDLIFDKNENCLGSASSHITFMFQNKSADTITNT